MLALAVGIHHQNNGSVIVHIPHNAGHGVHSGAPAGVAAAMPGYNFISAIPARANDGGRHHAIFFDAVHHLVHFFIIAHLKRMPLKGVQLRQRQDLDFLQLGILPFFLSGKQVIYRGQSDVFCEISHPFPPPLPMLCKQCSPGIAYYNEVRSPI